MIQLLMASSILFLIPAIYALTNRQCIIGAIITTCSIISFIFWSNPEDEIIREWDIMFARINFTYMVIHGLIYYDFSNTVELLMTLILLGLVIHTFMGSNYLYGDNNLWIFYHFFFHINCTLLNSIVIKNVIERSIL